METCQSNITSQSSFRNVTPDKKDDFNSGKTLNKPKSTTKIQLDSNLVKHTSSLNKKCSIQKNESNQYLLSIEEPVIELSVKKDFTTESPKQFNVTEKSFVLTEKLIEIQNIEHLALQKIQFINTNTANFGILEENQKKDLKQVSSLHQDSLPANNRSTLNYYPLPRTETYETKILDEQTISAEASIPDDSKINIFDQDSLAEETNTFGFQARSHITPSDPPLSPEKEQIHFTFPKTNKKSPLKNESASEFQSSDQFHSATSIKSNLRLSFSQNSQNTPNGFGTETKSEASDLLSYLENQSLLSKAMNFADIDTNETFIRNEDLSNNLGIIQELNPENKINQIDQITEPLINQIAHSFNNQIAEPLIDQITCINPANINPELMVEKLNTEQYDGSAANNHDLTMNEVEITQNNYVKCPEDLTIDKCEQLNTSNIMQIEDDAGN